MDEKQSYVRDLILGLVACVLTILLLVLLIIFGLTDRIEWLLPTIVLGVIISLPLIYTVSIIVELYYINKNKN